MSNSHDIVEVKKFKRCSVSRVCDASCKYFETCTRSISYISSRGEGFKKKKEDDSMRDENKSGRPKNSTPRTCSTFSLTETEHKMLDILKKRTGLTKGEVTGLAIKLLYGVCSCGGLEVSDDEGV